MVSYYENFDLTRIITPVNVDKLESLLTEANYDPEETAFVVNGFRNGFSLGYKGDTNVCIQSPNLKFRRIGNKMIGDKVTLWKL